MVQSDKIGLPCGELFQGLSEADYGFTMSKVQPPIPPPPPISLVEYITETSFDYHHTTEPSEAARLGLINETLVLACGSAQELAAHGRFPVL